MQRPAYFVRTRAPQQSPPPIPKLKNKLLPLILKRITFKKLQSTLTSIKNYSSYYTKRLQRVQRIASVNKEIFLHISWNKIRQYARCNKSEERIFKDIMILAKRIQRTVLQQAFFKLHKNINRINGAAYEKIVQSRKTILWHMLKKIYIKNKKNGWNKLKQNAMLYKLNKRINTIHIIFQNVYKRNLSCSFTKMQRFHIKNQSSSKKKKIQQLELQLQDFKIQVQNKNQNISRLYEEITELKQNSYIKPGDTSSIYFNTSFGNRSGSNLNRSRSKNMYYDREKDKQSNEGSLPRDNSFGSLLGLSVLSYRSRDRNSNSKITNKQQSCACSSCHYRQKYQKYKASTETLKKQLDLIKTQLEFTKDMNEHMQNQLNSQYNNHDEFKLEKIKMELKQCQKQRQSLREKMLKYQKYVEKLKLQFKGKIQDIYRKVRKNY